MVLAILLMPWCPLTAHHVGVLTSRFTSPIWGPFSAYWAMWLIVYMTMGLRNRFRHFCQMSRETMCVRILTERFRVGSPAARNHIR